MQVQIWVGEKTQTALSRTAKMMDVGKQAKYEHFFKCATMCINCKNGTNQHKKLKQVIYCNTNLPSEKNLDLSCKYKARFASDRRLHIHKWDLFSLWSCVDKDIQYAPCSQKLNIQRRMIFAIISTYPLTEHLSICTAVCKPCTCAKPQPKSTDMKLQLQETAGPLLVMSYPVSSLFMRALLRQCVLQFLMLRLSTSCRVALVDRWKSLMQYDWKQEEWSFISNMLFISVSQESIFLQRIQVWAHGLEPVI